MAITSLNLFIFLALSFLSISHSTQPSHSHSRSRSTHTSHSHSTHNSTSTIGAASLPPPPSSPPHNSPTLQPPQDLPDPVIFSHTSLLAPILSHLGFNELAIAAPSLSSDSTTAITWSGPYTIFAPSDSSVRTCISCSIPSLLREHMVPGLFTIDYLRKLTFGTKIETLSAGRCITVTSTTHNQKNFTIQKIFIGGVEITHPDLFNNGLVIIHGLQGYISPLSPFSCEVERMTSLSFPFQYDRSHNNQLPHQQQNVALMRIMLRDAILRLRNNGFTVLSLAMKIKYAELAPLNNVTIFALDDVSIFSGSYSYINNIRYHIVPNQFLTIADLERLPVGATLTTLDRGQSLVVTTPGGGILKNQMRINYVRIKIADMIRNLNVIVHSIYLPLPHVHPTSVGSETILSGVHDQTPMVDGIEEACEALDEQCGFGLSQVNHATTQVKPHVQPEIEDHHGL